MMSLRVYLIKLTPPYPWSHFGWSPLFPINLVWVLTSAIFSNLFFVTSHFCWLPLFRITFLHFLAKKSDVISGRPLIGTRKNVVESHSPTLNFRFKRFFRKATNANKKYRIVAPYLLQYTAKQLYMCVFLGDDVTILAYVKGYILSPKPLHLD